MRQSLCDYCKRLIPDEQDGYESTIIDIKMPNGNDYRFWLGAGVVLFKGTAELKYEKLDLCVDCFGVGIRAHTDEARR
jgi:hypothetical protein